MRSLLTGFYVALALLQTGCKTDRAARNVALPSSAATSAGRSPRPDCHRIQACLGVLPHDYDPSMDADLRTRVDRCIGATPAEKWDARECLPFEFGNHSKNGRRLEAYVVSGELMPYDTQAGFRYVDVQEIECVCLDGTRVLSGGLTPSYAGCAPGSIYPRESRTSFRVETRSATTRTAYEVIVVGSGPHCPLCQRA